MRQPLLFKLKIMEAVKNLTIENKGITGRYCEKIAQRFLIGIAETNPAVLSIFKDRDVKPYRDLLAWQGEFAGKYLTSAYYVYKQTNNAQLRSYALDFIEKLLAYQSEDGYLGCYSEETRFTGALPQTPQNIPWTWDCWAHYHISFSLILWYNETGNVKYLSAAEKIADLLTATFYNGKKTIVSTGNAQMNLAVYHSFALLYNLTKKEKYLDFALETEKDMSSDGAGDWLNFALNEKDFYTCPCPRWESLHVIMGFFEMYKATGDEKYRKALINTAKSILSTDVHNTGGFSTKEQAIGNPYVNGVIETCCVVAFNALAVYAYMLSGDISLVDFLERSHYNATLGSISPSGAWSTYDTPMEGEKYANFHFNDFQSRPGSPMLNCCSVNFGRGAAQISDWAVVLKGDGIYLNAFEKAVYRFDENELSVDGNYPCENKVRIRFSGRADKKLFVRIPSWSKNTLCNVDGVKTAVNAGEYAEFPAGREISLEFDYTPRFEKGGDLYKDKYSVYIGNILLAYDLTDNASFAENNGGSGFTAEERLSEMKLPELSFDDFKNCNKKADNDTLVITLKNGVKLVDFCHAGMTGGLYKTWLDIA